MGKRYQYTIAVYLRLALTIESKKLPQGGYQIDVGYKYTSDMWTTTSKDLQNLQNELEPFLQDELKEFLQERYLVDDFSLDLNKSDELEVTLQWQETFAESEMVDGEQPTEEALAELDRELTAYLETKYEVEHLELDEDAPTSFLLDWWDDPVPAAKKKWPIQRIKGASGNLFDPKSKANRLALNQLAGHLREIGFIVECHKDETTLRVYPTKRHQYPLLNPRFMPGCGAIEFDYLEIEVWSKGDRRTLHGHLKTFLDTRDCRFHVNDDFDPTRKPETLLWHGSFVLLLLFKANTINFRWLDERLPDLWQFLNDLPASKSR